MEKKSTCIEQLNEQKRDHVYMMSIDKIVVATLQISMKFAVKAKKKIS